MKQPREVAHDAAGWVPPMARLGYAAKGAVYLIVGWLAMRASMAAGEAEGATGALRSLVDEDGGRWILMVIALGLLAHVAWRVVQAVMDPEHRGERGDAKRLAMRVFYAISAVIYGSLAVTAWQLSRGRSEGDDDRSTWIAWLLDKPFGSWAVMLIGLGIIGYGLHQLYKAASGNVNKRIEAHDARAQQGMRTLGRIGTGARGLVLLPLGWFVFNAGRLYRADDVDMEAVLKMLGNGWLLGAVGFGLAAYGGHQIGKALYRRIERPV